jgi:hypothetical protein
MAIARGGLLVREKPLRHDEMQMVLSPGHSDVQQPAFLLDLRRGASAEIRWEATINHVQDEH